MKKLTSIFLVFGLLVSVAWASVPKKMRNDIVQMGIDSSTALKEFIFDVGDGATNPKITVDPAVKEFNMNKTLNITGDFTLSGSATIDGDDLTTGSGANVDQKHIYNIGNGGTNPYMGWDSTQNAFVFTNDGSLIKKIGSGSGGGDGGINILLNASAEDGLVNWTNIGVGSFTEVSNSERLEGEKSFEFNSINLDDRVVSDAVTLNDGLIGVACEARIYYTGGDENLILEVIDGNSDVIASQQLQTHTIANYESAFFLCPNATAIAGDAQKGNLQFQVRQSTGTNAAKIVFDKNHLGSLIGLIETGTPDSFGGYIQTNGSALYPYGDTISGGSGSAGVVTLTFSGLVEPPVCTATADDGANGTAQIDSISASGITIRTFNSTTGVAIGRAFLLTCHKTGADAKQSVQIYKSIPKISSNVNEFSSFISDAGGVNTENVDWINGACTKGGTGVFNCNFNSGVFPTVIPACQVSVGQVTGADRCVSIDSVGTTSISFRTFTCSTGALANYKAALSCSKQGADFKMPIVQPIVIPNAVFYGPYDLTITAAGWTTSNAKAHFKNVNGTWYMVFSLSGSIAPATANPSLNVSGVSFAFQQDISVSMGSGGKLYAVAEGGGTLTITGSTSTGLYWVSGSVQLDSKPTMYVPQ